MQGSNQSITTAERETPAHFEPLESRRLLSTVVGLTPNNQLVQFDTNNTQDVASRRNIGGLNAGDKVVGIDYRAANLQLYGVVDGTAVDRVIRIDPSTGNSTNVFNLTTPLAGTEFGVDFNAVADALRITSDANQNLRVPFATGATIVDGNLMYGANDFNAGMDPNVTASAYTNSFAGTTATVLYDIDSQLDILAIQNPPNAGTLMTRGPLGVDSGPMIGFDIQAASSSQNYNPNNAFVSLSRPSETGARLYRIDIATGGVRDAGAVGGTGSRAVALRDITLKPSTSRYSGGGYSWSGGYSNDRDYSSGSSRSSSYSDSTRDGSNQWW